MSESRLLKIITQHATVRTEESLYYFMLQGWNVVGDRNENGEWALERPNFDHLDLEKIHGAIESLEGGTEQ